MGAAVIRIKVPTLYEAAYVLPKKRTEETVWMMGDISIGLRELTPDEAPVAHVIADRTRDKDPQLVRYNPFRTGTPVRSHEGRFYVARWPVEDFADAAASDDHHAPFNGFFVSGKNEFGHEKHVLMGMGSKTEKTYASQSDVEAKKGTFRKWIDRYSDTAAAMTRRAEDFIVVDGLVHELIGEPVIQVEKFGDLVTINIGQARQPETPFGRRSSEFARGFTFGIDQLDRAIEVAGMIAGDEGRIANYVDIEMVSPWAIRHRGEPHMIRQVAKLTISTTADMLAQIPAQAGLAWHDLVTAYEENDGTTPGLIESLRRFHAAMALRLPDESLSNNVHLCRADKYGDNNIDARTALALSIWDGRDPSGIEWIERASEAPPTYLGDLMVREILTLEQADVAGAAIGRPLDLLADEASAGRGRLILVDDAKGPTVAALIAIDGPEVLETVTRHGKEPSEHIHAAIAAHAASLAVPEANIGMELADLGL